MRRESQLAAQTRRVAGVLTARRITWPAVAWGTVSGGYITYAAVQFATTYPTAASREQVALTFSSNAGLTALLGEGQRLATVAGFTAWRAVGVLVPVGAVWAMLAATRLTRGEEDAGRTELLLAGQTTRRRAVAQAIAGIAAGIALAWAITAAAAVLAGTSAKVAIPAGGALFLATAVTAGPAMFAAAGVLAGQLAASRRQANGITAAILAASLLIRIIADSSPGLHWARWLSPLGWAEQLHPLTCPEPMALLPIAALTAVLAAGAIALAGRRDLGAGVIPSRDTSRSRLLASSLGLAWRLARPAAVGWAAGLSVLGLIGGLVAPAAAKAISHSADIRDVLGRLGAQPDSAAYLGVIYLIGAALTCLAAASQITTTQAEEADGHASQLLARPVSRSRWLAGRLAVAAAVIIAASLAAGLAGWAGLADQHTGLGIAQLVKAGLNIAPPALFVLGAGCLAYGAWPRLVSLVAYGLVAWSFLIELLATVITSRWLLDTSVLHHIQPVPAAQPDWTTAAWLTGLGVLTALTGTMLFNRRDLAGT